ncbi:MAG: Ni/Fe hydrogenase subunit alpha [Ignavibacteria bacterium]|nr:MAG: Ni/Fe hydrogenase subunit alpha [Ignavibacteria bacterium]
MTESRREIVIDPVTRVEGHARISIMFNEHGRVEDARLHVAEFRGFEAICTGRLIWEMPRITSRICGVCPVSHAVTSAKAGDEILAVTIPRTAEQLRRILVLGQWIQSHAMSFFHLSSPDLLLGFDQPAESRDFFTVMRDNEEFARRGIRLRKYGQEVISRLAGKRIHADFVIPGGVRSALSEQNRDILLDGLPEAHSTIRMALDFMKAWLESPHDSFDIMGSFPSLSIGMINEHEELEYYDGTLRITDAAGNIVADRIDPRTYRDFIAEENESWSYMRFPYYQPLGPTRGMYRVGPLARLNVCARTGTPRADAELTEYRQRTAPQGTAQNSLYYHYARLIEILFALERIEQLLTDPETLRSDTLRSRAFSNRPQGVAATEAPRGTLFHNFSAGSDGVVNRTDLLIATAQNNLAMNRGIRQIATHLLDGPGQELPESLLNMIEAGIRSYDPCFSCATHALGRMPLRVDYRDQNGALLRSFARKT